MKQAEAQFEGKTARKNNRKRKSLIYRRIGAGLLVAMAVATSPA